MAQLLVRKVPDAIAQLLRHRAIENGVSTEEEHRRILCEALAPKTTTLFDHIRELGEIAPELELDRSRKRGNRPSVEF